MASNSGSVGFFARAQNYSVIFASVYVAFLAALLSPWLQAHFLFLHKVQFPLFADFNNPVRYGVAPYKGRNFKITTSDNVTIGAWHLVPDAFVKANGKGPYSEEQYDQALCDYPTVIYLHGNAANRAAPFRIATYTQVTSRLNANVVAIDYRGFGDSQGFPSEKGLVKDAKAAWEWVQAHRNKAPKKRGLWAKGTSSAGTGVIIMGQSLGTGVAAQAALELTESGTPPQGLVLIAPYSSLRNLITGYRLGGVIPIFGPLDFIPFSNHFLDRILYTQFNTSAVLPLMLTASRKLPPSAYPKVIIDHATDDEVIPYDHSELIFEKLLQHELGNDYPEHPFGGDLQKMSAAAAAGAGEGSDALSKMRKYKEDMDKARAKLVRKETIEGFGTVETMVIHHEGAAAAAEAAAGITREDEKTSPTVTLIRTHHGGHNRIGEGVVDLVGEIILS